MHVGNLGMVVKPCACCLALSNGPFGSRSLGGLVPSLPFSLMVAGDLLSGCLEGSGSCHSLNSITAQDLESHCPLSGSGDVPGAVRVRARVLSALTYQAWPSVLNRSIQDKVMEKQGKETDSTWSLWEEEVQ